MNFLSANSANRTADRTVKQYDNLTLCDSLISAHMLWIRISYRNLKLIHIHFYRGKVWRAAPLRYHSKTVQVMKMAMQELVVVCKCQWQGVVLLRGRSLHRSYTGSLGNKTSAREHIAWKIGRLALIVVCAFQLAFEPLRSGWLPVCWVAPALSYAAIFVVTFHYIACEHLLRLLFLSHCIYFLL